MRAGLCKAQMLLRFRDESGRSTQERRGRVGMNTQGRGPVGRAAELGPSPLPAGAKLHAEVCRCRGCFPDVALSLCFRGAVRPLPGGPLGTSERLDARAGQRFHQRYPCGVASHSHAGGGGWWGQGFPVPALDLLLRVLPCGNLLPGYGYNSRVRACIRGSGALV